MIELYVLGMCDKQFHYFFSLEVLWVLRQNRKFNFTFTSIDCDLIFFSEAPKVPPLDPVIPVSCSNMLL
jgi:hypothetical protein